MRVLVLDNYDSFTWNLVHQIESLGGSCVTRRSDEIALEDITSFNPDRIVLSPGPFGPDRAGICGDVVRAFMGRIPILGVCLGMQVIASVIGARVEPSGRPVHGKTSLVSHNGHGLFAGVSRPFAAARYHSLQVMAGSAPHNLQITAWCADGTIMGCRVPDQRLEGVLFHPESFLTEHGSRIISNFLRN